MSNPHNELAQFIKLNDEINAQLIHTPNYFHSLEEVFNYLKTGKEDHFRYLLYNYLNKSFQQFLSEHNLKETANLSPNLKDLFKAMAIKDVKSVRDQLIRQRKYLSAKRDTPIESDHEYLREDYNEKYIQEYLDLNLNALISQLLTGQPLSINNEAHEERFKQIEVLVDNRETYHQQALSNLFSYAHPTDGDYAAIVDKIDFFVTGIYLDRIKANVGQCGEHTALAIYKLFKEGHINDNDVIEIIHTDYINDGIFQDNHVFIVKNRYQGPGSDLNDISTWGDDAIVFDSWKKTTFLAKDYLSHRFIDFDGKKISRSLKFTIDDINILNNLEKNDLMLQMTGFADKEKLTTALIEENQLISLDNPRLVHTKKYLTRLLKSCRPPHFETEVDIYLSTDGSRLIDTIAGFIKPTIVIDLAFLNKLIASDEKTFSELKFALAHTLFTIKDHGIGISDELSAVDQFNLDKSALHLCQDSEAAINYLRRAAIFKKDLQNSDEILSLTKIMDTRRIAGSFEQRIKNLMTYLAKNHTAFEKNKKTDIDELKTLRFELKQIEAKYFYKHEFEKQENNVKKLSFLTTQLSSLKENEILPYELIGKPSIRVRQFCQHIRELTINWDNMDEVAAIDNLITKAFTLKVPGFDRIYLACLNFDEKHYFQQRTKEDVLYCESKKEAFKPLGIFKEYQQNIFDFTHAKSFKAAKNAAQRLHDLGDSIKSAFASCNAHYHNLARDYLQKYREENRRKIPTNDNRYYGTWIGSQCCWQGFKNQDIKRIYNYLRWSVQDKDGLIARALWSLGITKPSQVLTQLPREMSEGMLHDRSTNLINIPLPKSLSHLHVHQLDSAITIIKLLSAQHRLNTTMFNLDLPFEEQFTRFYDANFAALRVPGYLIKVNDDNETVRFLLKRFCEIAQHGTPEERSVVKSFFTGRKDKRDLVHLVKGDGSNFEVFSKFNLKSPYLQFCLYQRFKNSNFDLFSNEEMLSFLKSYCGTLPIPIKMLLSYFKLDAPVDIDNLTAFGLKIREYDINFAQFNTHRLFIKFLKNTGPYPLFSAKAAKLIRMLITLNGVYDGRLYISQKELLAHLRWIKPCEKTITKLDIKDLIAIYRCYEQNLFFKSFAEQQYLGEVIIKKLSSLTSKTLQLEAIEELLECHIDKFRVPIGDIQFRDALIDLWTKLVREEYGIDNGSQSYFEKIKPLLERMKNNLPKRDLEFIFSKLANTLVTQKNVSEYIGVLICPEKYLDAVESRKSAVNEQAVSTLGAATTFLGDDFNDQSETLDFIGSPITTNRALHFATYLVDTNKAKKLLKILYPGASDSFFDNIKKREERINITQNALFVFYHNFWDRTLEERAVLTDYLTVPASKMIDENEIEAAYDRTLDYAAKKLFPHAAASESDDSFALAILKSYLKTANRFERSLLLSAILVVSNTSAGQGEAISPGKKLALLCEQMGPAYIKLAQAIHSHPQTPSYIKDDLAHVKGHANPPHRWDLWRLLLDVLPDESISTIKRVGKLLGSASYNLALEVELQSGEQQVLILLRENAEKLAKEGFKHLQDTISDCKHQRMIKIRNQLHMILDEAEALSQAEVDYHVSDEQNKVAHKMYQLPLTVIANQDQYNVLITPSSIIKSGYGYRFMERMYGDEFNDLPAVTPLDNQIKKIIAIAVFTTELINILKGDIFDCDRHGNQCRALIDKENKTIYLGLYDFGEMGPYNFDKMQLQPPSSFEIKQLANVLHSLANPLVGPHSSFNDRFDAILTKHIEKALEHKQPTHYLVRVRKALLALQDFKKCLNSKDIFDILNTIKLNHKDSIHPVLAHELEHCLKNYKMANTIKQKVQHIHRFFSRKRRDFPDQKDIIGEKKMSLHN